jgi:hypothetical protein
MRQLSKKSLSWQIAVPTVQKPRSYTDHSYACRQRRNSSSEACTFRCSPIGPSGPTSAEEL